MPEGDAQRLLYIYIYQSALGGACDCAWRLCPALVKQKQNSNSWARRISPVLLYSDPPMGAMCALMDIYTSKGGAAVRWSAHHGFFVDSCPSLSAALAYPVYMQQASYFQCYMEQTHNTMMVMAFAAPMNARQHSSLVWPLPVSPADDPHNSAGCDCIHRYQHTYIQR